MIIELVFSYAVAELLHLHVKTSFSQSIKIKIKKNEKKGYVINATDVQYRSNVI